jgi:ribosomal subunit interface protein
MKQPLNVLFLGMDASDAVEAAARKKANRLGRFCPDILSCRVTIEVANKHQLQGRPFSVRVDVRIPEHELSVSRVHDEDVHVALREAFDDMKRQLKDSMRRTRATKPSQARRPRAAISKAVDVTAATVVERPDGYYWSGLDGSAEFGPYETYELAQAARDAVSEEGVAPGTAVLEAERQIGVADWIDVETGEPAQGQSPPHLQED